MHLLSPAERFEPEVGAGDAAPAPRSPCAELHDMHMHSELKIQVKTTARCRSSVAGTNPILMCAYRDDALVVGTQ